MALATRRLNHAGGLAEAGEAVRDMLAHEGVGVVSAHLIFVVVGWSWLVVGVVWVGLDM